MMADGIVLETGAARVGMLLGRNNERGINRVESEEDGAAEKERYDQEQAACRLRNLLLGTDGTDGFLDWRLQDSTPGPPDSLFSFGAKQQLDSRRGLSNTEA
jgi:hypothetical protein